jgi:Mpv17-like protein
MSKLLKFIKYAFNSHPIVSNALVYGTLYVGAEFSQQTVTRKLLAKTPVPYDTPTIGRYAIFGTTVQGPLLTVWYLFFILLLSTRQTCFLIELY